MQKWFSFSWLICLCSAQVWAQDNCALFVVPEINGTSHSYAATFGTALLRSIFPTGLIPPGDPTETVTGDPLSPPAVQQPAVKLDSVESSAEIPLPGLERGSLVFAQLWYHGAEKGRPNDEALANYTVVRIPYLDSVDIWLIEHPVKRTVENGNSVYAMFNIHQTHPPEFDYFLQIPVLPVIHPQDARLSMYLAALAVPRMESDSISKRWVQPVLKPMLISQGCNESDCYSQVRIDATFTHFENWETGVEGKGFFKTSYKLTVHTQNGKLKSIQRDGWQDIKLDPKVVDAFETLAPRI